ncbi:hypothetical protein J2S34_002522 [Nitrobacter winogradskyi]|uniref:Uncharacterized protein n=1 Tax=Nitrobacter winogradskyi TaxID=913 RepID=A0ACC6AK80_NITWI|nr:hypothetical protein [Nitrobacter winogradskyi]
MFFRNVNREEASLHEGDLRNQANYGLTHSQIY